MTDFLANYVDPETAGLLAMVMLAALALLVLYILYRVVAGARERRFRAEHARLSIIDAEEVDGRRRLVLVRRDDVEHLIMVGGPTDLVIESGIGANRVERSERRPTPPPSEPKPKTGDKAKQEHRREPEAAEPPVAVQTPSPPVPQVERIVATSEREPSAPKVEPVAVPRPKPAATPPTRREPVLETPVQTDAPKPAAEPRQGYDAEIDDLLAEMKRDADAPR